MIRRVWQRLYDWFAGPGGWFIDSDLDAEYSRIDCELDGAPTIPTRYGINVEDEICQCEICLLDREEFNDLADVIYPIWSKSQQEQEAEDYPA